MNTLSTIHYIQLTTQVAQLPQPIQVISAVKAAKCRELQLYENYLYAVCGTFHSNVCGECFCYGCVVSVTTPLVKLPRSTQYAEPRQLYVYSHLGKYGTNSLVLIANNKLHNNNFEFLARRNKL